MTDSIIPLHLILVSKICMYLPSLFLIDPPRIKDPDTPHICSQMPYMLPLKNKLVLSPPLLIDQIFFLLLFLILSMV